MDENKKIESQVLPNLNASRIALELNRHCPVFFKSQTERMGKKPMSPQKIGG
jgi:hypothetical protein